MIEDLAGMVFGRWTVLARDANSRDGRVQWLCLCQCGVKGVVAGRGLKSGRSASCGCLKIDINSSFEDLTGMVFGRLTVLGLAKKGGHYKWHCRCSCGTDRVVLGRQLKTGGTASCGCLRAEITGELRRSHGHSVGRKASPTLTAYRGMLDRTTNPNSRFYRHYGGRGIKVCDRWLEGFENFLSDMGVKPHGLSLDRIDNDGDYGPGNCRWTTQKVQCRNQRRVRLLKYGGEIRPLVEWAERLGIQPMTLKARLDKLKWSVEKALTTPVRCGGQNRGNYKATV